MKRQKRTTTADDAIATTLADELAWLKRETARLRKEYERERTPELFHEYRTVQDQMVKVQKVAAQGDIEAGSAVSRADVEALWKRIGQEMRSSLEAIPTRAATHSLFASLDPVAVEEFLEAELERCFAQLSKTPFP